MQPASRGRIKALIALGGIGGCATTSVYVAPTSAKIPACASAQAIDTTVYDDSVRALTRPVLRSAKGPAYPSSLVSQRIEGSVEFAYILDASGRVEAGSLKVLSATNPEFVAPSRITILSQVFSPACFAGHPVRMRSTQMVKFQIG